MEKVKEKSLPAENDPKRFSAVAHTLVYKPHEGFADYAVAKLTIEKGAITKIELSDPYGAVEARIKLDKENHLLLEKMRVQYPSGFRHV